MLRVVGRFFHLPALQVAYEQQRAVFIIRLVQVARIPRPWADSSSHSLLCCCGSAPSPALRVSQELAGFAFVPPPSPWEERTAHGDLHGGIPKLPSCPWPHMGGTGLQVMLVLWRWRCRKFTAVIKGCRLSDAEIPEGCSDKCCHLSTAWSLPETRKYQWILKILFSDVIHSLGTMNVPCPINMTVVWLRFSLP